MRENLLGPAPLELPDDPAQARLDAGESPRALVPEFPASCAVWAALATAALDADDAVTGYAFARTGYHRGLDLLRRNGWKGGGPVPWSHAANRGVLRAIAALGRAAAAIGEDDEVARIRELLLDADPSLDPGSFSAEK